MSKGYKYFVCNTCKKTHKVSFRGESEGYICKGCEAVKQYRNNVDSVKSMWGV